MIRRWGWNNIFAGEPQPSVPFVSSVRMLDIPHTVSAAINNLNEHCVAVVVRYDGLNVNGRFIADVERTARHKGIRVLWVRVRSALHG